MKNRKHVSSGVVLLALCAAVVVSATALGQNYPNSVEITGVGGGSFGKQIYQNGLTAVDVGTAVEYGAQLGYNFTQGIGIEGAWTYSNPSLEATSLATGGLSGKIGTVKTNIYELDGLFSTGGDSASFYAVVGAGATSLSPQIGGVSTTTSTRLSWSGGIGGKFWLTQNFGFRLEGRWRWIDTGHTTNSGVWCDAFGNCYGYSTSLYSHADATGGLTVRF